jgi:hypothetical protein
LWLGAGQKIDQVKLQKALEQIGFHLQEVGGLWAAASDLLGR